MTNIQCNTCNQFGHYAVQCHLPNPTKVPPAMLNTNNSPKTEPPFGSPRYTPPLPKQPPNQAPVKPHIDNTTVHELTIKVNALLDQQQQHNAHMRKIQQQRCNLQEVEPTKFMSSTPTAANIFDAQSDF